MAAWLAGRRAWVTQELDLHPVLFRGSCNNHELNGEELPEEVAVVWVRGAVGNLLLVSLQSMWSTPT